MISSLTVPWLEFALLLCIAVLLPIIPAYVLYKTLPARTTISGPFKGLNIQLTGSFGGYFLVLIVVVGLISSRQQPARYEVWSVTGKVTLKNNDPRDKLLHKDFSVQPPTIILYPDGRFDLDVPVKRGQNDNLEFPVIVINHDGYLPQTIPLGDQQPTFGGKPYKIVSDDKAKKRIIDNQIELDPLPTGGSR
ncbi:MAG: hypothetical protein QMD03_06205 [Syntrophales bacterium]|nr:hypothetical protein [Syntrophales bacterium]